MTSDNKHDDMIKGHRLRLGRVPNVSERITLTYTIDEALFSQIKFLHIWPSTVIVKELRREVRRRQRGQRERARRRIVNRFSGEILTTR